MPGDLGRAFADHHREVVARDFVQLERLADVAAPAVVAAFVPRAAGNLREAAFDRSE